MSEKDSIPFTKEGYEELSAELVRLKKGERPQVIADIEEARGHGDLKENAEYHAAKERQAFIEGRIADLEDKLARAQVIEPQKSETKVRFGAVVSVCDEENGEEKTYRIVGDLEANLEKMKISVSSPIAKALLGKEVNDLVEVRAPKGIREYLIKDVRY